MMAEAIYPTYVARKKNSRISPRKLRLAADLIRGKDVQRATELLQFSVTESSRIMGKVLANAVSNAENQSADIDNLTIARVLVDKGIVLKRRKPSGRGRMRGVYHRYSNVGIFLEDRSVRSVAKVTEIKGDDGSSKDVVEQPEEAQNVSTDPGEGREKD